MNLQNILVLFINRKDVKFPNFREVVKCISRVWLILSPHIIHQTTLLQFQFLFQKWEKYFPTAEEAFLFRENYWEVIYWIESINFTASGCCSVFIMIREVNRRFYFSGQGSFKRLRNTWAMLECLNPLLRRITLSWRFLLELP